MTTILPDGNILISHKTGGPALARGIPKELTVSILTIFGVLSTVGISVMLRHVLPLRNLVITGEDAFVVFTIYGLAFSLISSASTVIRKKDAMVLILAATVIWGIFVEEHRVEMIRFITFATLITLGVLLGRWISSSSAKGIRISLGAILPGALCGVGGVVYYSVAGRIGQVVGGFGAKSAAGLLWGLSLGLAVGVGIAIGSEVVEWLLKKAG